MNLSRNEKITLMLLLIGILVVIYLYTNKQEKLDRPPAATPPAATPPAATPPAATPPTATPPAATPPTATDIVNKLKENAVTIISSSYEDIRKVLTDPTNTYFCIFENGNITTIKYDNNKLSLVYSSYYDIWSISVFSGYKYILQNDGNLVLYYIDMSSNLVPVWSTGTYSFGPSSMFLDQNGNLIIKAKNGSGLWNSSKNTYNNILKLESEYSEKKNQRFMDEFSSFLVEINSQTPQDVKSPQPIMSDKNQMCAEFIENIKNKDVELNTCNVMYKDQLQKINTQDNLIQQQSQQMQNPVKWISNTQINKNIRKVDGGKEGNKTLYVCNANYNNGVHSGKTWDGYNACNIGWGGREIPVKNFNYLTYNI